MILAAIAHHFYLDVLGFAAGVRYFCCDLPKFFPVAFYSLLDLTMFVLASLFRQERSINFESVVHHFRLDFAIFWLPARHFSFDLAIFYFSVFGPVACHFYFDLAMCVVKAHDKPFEFHGRRSSFSLKQCEF